MKVLGNSLDHLTSGLPMFATTKSMSFAKNKEDKN
jgi:hypothetical protein